MDRRQVQLAAGAAAFQKQQLIVAELQRVLMAQTLGVARRDRAVVQARAIERPKVLEVEGTTIPGDATMVATDLVRCQHHVDP